MIGVIVAKNGKICEPFMWKNEKKEKCSQKIVSKCFSADSIGKSVGRRNSSKSNGF